MPRRLHPVREHAAEPAVQGGPFRRRQHAGGDLGQVRPPGRDPVRSLVGQPAVQQRRDTRAEQRGRDRPAQQAERRERGPRGHRQPAGHPGRRRGQARPGRRVRALPSLQLQRQRVAAGRGHGRRLDAQRRRIRRRQRGHVDPRPGQ
jgi:hypothetical protein